MDRMDEAEIERHITNYLKKSRFPDVMQEWKGEDFDLKIHPEDFRKIAEDLGITKQHRVLHTHTTSDYYKKLLEKIAGVVDAYDISAVQAHRAGSSVANAERIHEFVRGKYDHALIFEPAEFFHWSGSVFGSAALVNSLLHALKNGGRIHIIMRDYVTGGSPADNAEALLNWLSEHFGINWKKVGKEPFTYVRDNAGSRRPVSVMSIWADEEGRRLLDDFVRTVDRAILEGLKRGKEDGVRGALEELKRTKVKTRSGERKAIEILQDYLWKYRTYMRTL